MLKYRLSVALSSALLLTTIGVVQAQDKATDKQAAPPKAPAAGQAQAPAAAGQAPTAPQTPPPPKVPAPTDVVGSVNGKQITWADLLERIRTENPTQFTGMAAQSAGPKVATSLFGPDGKPEITLTRDDVLAAIRQNPPPGLSQLLDGILMQDALNQEAAKEGLVVTNVQVEDYIKTQLKQLRANNQIPQGQSDEAFLANLITQRHTTREQLDAQMRAPVIVQALAKKEIGKQLGHPVSPADFVQIRMLLIKAPEITPASKAPDKKADADALAKIEKISAEIKAGKKTFVQEVKDYSEDFASKAQNGELPPFLRGSQTKEIETEAFKLKTNEVSPPVRASVGYYLIQVVKQGQELSEDQRTQILAQREQETWRTYMPAMTQRLNLTNNLRPTGPPGGLGGPRQVPGAPRGQNVRQ